MKHGLEPSLAFFYIYPNDEPVYRSNCLSPV